MGRHSEAKEGYFCLMRRSNGYYYYWVYDKFNRRIYRSTGQKTRARAMDVAMRRWKDGALLDVPKPVYHSFIDYASGFWDWDTCPIIQDKIRRGGHYSREMAASNAKITDKHITPFFRGVLLEEITPRMATDWLLRLPAEHGISNKTSNNVLTIFRQILDAAVADGLIDRNPARAVKPLIKDGTRYGCFTVEQVKALFASPWENMHLFIMCRLAAVTGMRLGEVQALNRGQIKTGYLNVNASWAKKEGRKTTKSGYGRVVPLDPDTMALLRSILPPEDDDLLFTLDGKKPLSGSLVRYALRSRMDELNGGKPDKEKGTAGKLFDYMNKKAPLTYHSFRHFFNTRLVAAGIDGQQIRAVVGHESEDMTEHYLHLSAEDMECIRAVQRGIAM